MELKDFVNEIIDIAKTNNVSWDVGADMFLANIRNCGDETLPYYPGAYLDYPALKLELEAMSAEQVAEMKNDFAYWYRAHAEDICNARG